jgi:hypothetical protein
VLVLGFGGLVAYVAISTDAKAGTHKLVPPDDFQGLPSDQSSPLLAQLSSTESDIAKDGVTPFATVYSRHVGDKLPQIVFMGGYGKVLDPDTELSQVWQGIGSGSDGKLEHKTDEPAGPLGGHLQCAIGTGNGVTMPMCAWADNSSVALVMFLGKGSDNPDTVSADLTSVAQQTLALRTAAEVPK